VCLRGASEADPRRIGHFCSVRPQPEVDDDQREAGRDEELGRHHRLLRRLRTDPENARELGAGVVELLRVEMIAQVD